ncbi:MAG: FecR domain-containing protein, partial [Planctomycetaceae bacterium]|nr:FecR domain-containing protein [Planctomycetaceae bacterium]
MTPEDIELLERVLDRSADADTLSRLVERLRTDAAFRADVADALHLDGLMQAGLGPDASCERLAEVVSVAIPSNGRALDSRVMAQIRDQGIVPGPGRRFRLAALLGAAAAILLAVAAALLYSGTPGAAVVAWGGDVAVERDGETLPERIPSSLRGGDTVHVRPNSWAWVRYADGTTLQIDSDSAVAFEEKTIGDAKRVRILHGVVFVEAARQAPDRPMLLRTPHSETKVLGTSFSLAVGKDATKLLVREGKVAFSKADAAIEVRGGQAATASPSLPLTAEPLRGELLRRLGKDHFMLGVMSG